DGTVTYTHDGSETTSDSFTYTVNDGDSDSAAATVTISVTAVNDPPSITSTAATSSEGDTATEAVLYTYAATVNDADVLDVNDGGGSLVWTLANEPTGMTVSTTGVVTWTPADGILTSGTVTLTVTDGDGASDSEDFTIEVVVVVDTSYILNYEASSELLPSDGTWDYVTGETDFDFEVSNATLTNSPQTSYSGISQAYIFDGSSGGSMPSLESISGDPTDSNASFELWFRPESLSGEQILFETGALSAGMVLYLSEKNLVFATKGGFKQPLKQISVDLTGIQADPTAEFIQAVAVIDITGSQIKLFINGVSKGFSRFTGVDWAKDDNTGLGGASGESGKNVVAGRGLFNGDIAIVRFYEKALTESEVQDNFSAISGGAE
ncbi:MAG: hypothetical protein GY814_12525, partial [Gammaproteobacteria bacterium]|nr:hypothetical protein [Gammaproteobacteria bacterium]